MTEPVRRSGKRRTVRGLRTPPSHREAAGVVRGLVVGLALASLIAGCVVRHLVGPRLTGTCQGACAHYTDCKRGATSADRDRCRAECPEVFSDRDSLMAFESLSCADAVEYVDGSQRKVAKPR